MNSSIPNAIQTPLKYGDNLVTHAIHPSEALSHDLVRFTIDYFFPRRYYVANLNGKRETKWRRRRFSKRMCKLWPKQRRKNNTTKQKMMLELDGSKKNEHMIGLRDKDGIELEAIEPAQEAPKEKKSKKVTIMTKYKS